MAPAIAIQGGNSGCAAIVVYPEHLGGREEQIVDFGCSESSNQRDGAAGLHQSLEVDSFQFTVACWRRNDWRNQYNEPRENADLWREFLSAYQKIGMPVHFEWTPGKKTPILKAIDRAAKDAAKMGLANEAWDRGADAIIGIRMDIMGRHTEKCVLVYGTAVKCKRSHNSTT